MIYQCLHKYIKKIFLQNPEWVDWSRCFWVYCNLLVSKVGNRIFTMRNQILVVKSQEATICSHSLPRVGLRQLRQGLIYHVSISIFTQSVSLYRVVKLYIGIIPGVIAQVIGYE